MRHMTGTRDEIEAAIAIEDAYQKYPRPGTDSDGAPVRPGWDGRGNPPAGWTVTCATPRRHPQRREFSVAVDGAAHESRLVGRRVAGRLVYSGDIRERSPDWEPVDDTQRRRT